MKGNKKERITVEWKKDLKNIGCFAPQPFSILLDYIKDKDILKIIDHFFSQNLKEISLLDLCVLNLFWSKDGSIVAARSSWFKHPTHHSSEFIFDKEEERLIVEVRQPDLEGKSWKSTHIHVVRGQIDTKNNCKIIKPNFHKHVKLIRTPINGKWIIKIK